MQTSGWTTTSRDDVVLGKSYSLHYRSILDMFVEISLNLHFIKGKDSSVRMEVYRILPATVEGKRAP